MKKFILVVAILLPVLTLVRPDVLRAQAPQGGTAYEKSLHYTNRGLEYWYAKENGGLERITGVPFSNLACNGCHVRNCDACHVNQANGKSVYTLEAARSETACETCHAMESQTFAKKNPGDRTADVHFGKGMRCMDCHSAREIHGDGTAYDTIQSPGVLDTTCDKCHEQDSAKCPSNTIHAGKVDCSACHVRYLQSCYNCHMDTKVKEGRSVSIPLNNLLFLVNHNGKVTLGNLHTFIYQNKTMVVFAPSYSHWLMKEGRKCNDCHATQIVQDMKKGTYRPVSWEQDWLKNVSGIVPVLDGYKWNFPFLNYSAGKWLPAGSAAAPILQYSGNAKPLTQEQFDKLAKPQSKR